MLNKPIKPSVTKPRPLQKLWSSESTTHEKVLISFMGGTCTKGRTKNLGHGSNRCSTETLAEHARVGIFVPSEGSKPHHGHWAYSSFIQVTSKNKTVSLGLDTVDWLDRSALLSSWKHSRLPFEFEEYLKATKPCNFNSNCNRSNPAHALKTVRKRNQALKWVNHHCRSDGWVREVQIGSLASYWSPTPRLMGVAYLSHDSVHGTDFQTYEIF